MSESEQYSGELVLATKGATKIDGKKRKNSESAESEMSELEKPDVPESSDSKRQKLFEQEPSAEIVLREIQNASKVNILANSETKVVGKQESEAVVSAVTHLFSKMVAKQEECIIELQNRFKEAMIMWDWRQMESLRRLEENSLNWKEVVETTGKQIQKRIERFEEVVSEKNQENLRGQKYAMQYQYDKTKECWEGLVQSQNYIMQMLWGNQQELVKLSENSVSPEVFLQAYQRLQSEFQNFVSANQSSGSMQDIGAEYAEDIKLSIKNHEGKFGEILTELSRIKKAQGLNVFENEEQASEFKKNFFEICINQENLLKELKELRDSGLNDQTQTSDEEEVPPVTKKISTLKK